MPDVEFGRRAHGLDGLTDKQVGYVMHTRQRELTGSEFLSLEQQRIVAISIAMRTREGFKIWTLGEATADERDLVRRFFDGIDRYSPTLVSWNGDGFDLPVLTTARCVMAYRPPATGKRVTATRAYRWNNYISRYHWRHVDLMDVLSGFQGRGRVGLDNMAMLLGFPGKLGMSGAGVWDAHPRRPQRRHPQLLRDGCHQHLPDLPALRADAGPTHARRTRPRMSNWCAAGSAVADDRTCVSLRRRVAGQPVTERHETPADGTRAGRHRRSHARRPRAWRASTARPSSWPIRCPDERVVLRRTHRQRKLDYAVTEQVIARESGPRAAAVSAFRRLRRLRAAAPRAGSTARIQAVDN